MEDGELFVVRVKMAITKRFSWKGKQEEFANTYTYEDVVNTEQTLDDLVNAIVLQERAIHGFAVTFVRAQVWDIGTVPNLMRYTKELTGTGQLSGTEMARELCIVAKFPFPRRAGLRRTIHRASYKYLHVTALPSGWNPHGENPFPTPVAGGPHAAYLTTVRSPIVGVNLVAPNGDLTTGPGKYLPYATTRQLRRGRKESA